MTGARETGRRFVMNNCLGRGGFGEVYRATMSSSGGVRTEVAVKILRADIDPGSDSVKRLSDEGRLLGALRHPSILRVHDLLLLDSRVALVTEFVDGEDLDQALSNGAIPPRVLVAVVGEVAAALHAAWGSISEATGGQPLHLVHRDVKPANIRLGRHGEVKLLDFGIAMATNLVREAQTGHDSMMGSFLYMAPERYTDEGPVKPPSDVYSLGCVLFEAITRERFFQELSLKQIYGLMLGGGKLDVYRTERLQLLDSSLPESVRVLVSQMLETDPESRPTAQQVAHRCEDLSEDLSGPSLKKWARQRAWNSPNKTVGSLEGRELLGHSFAPSSVVAAEHEQLGATAAPTSLPPIDMMGMLAPPVPTGQIPLVRPEPEILGGTPVPAPVASMPPGVELAPSPVFAPAEPAAETVEPAPTPAPAPQAPTPAPAPQAAAPPAAPTPAPAPSAPEPSVEVGPPPPSTTPAPMPSRPIAFDNEPSLGLSFGGVEPGPAPDPIPGVLDDNPPPIVGFGAASSEDDEFDRVLEEMAERRQRRTMLTVAAIVVVVLLLGMLGAVGMAASFLFAAPDATEQPVPGAPVEPEPAEEPEPVEKPEPVEEPEPTEVPEKPAPEPEPEPEPVAEPEPAEPKAPTAASLRKDGWNTAGSNPGKAAELFKQSLDMAPGSADGNYGYGYCLLQLGRAGEAKPYLCKASASGDTEIKRDVNSMLDRNSMSCD